MKRATRRVQVEDLRELLERPPRANITFRAGDGFEAAPVAFRYDGGRYVIGLSAAGAAPAPGDPVKLLIDDGTWFFDLRGVWVRGRTVPADPPPGGASAPLTWLEIMPEKVVAWDYGTLRRVPES